MNNHNTKIINNISTLKFLKSQLISIHQLNTLIIISKQHLNLTLQTLQSQKTKFQQHKQFLNLYLIHSNISQTNQLTITITIIQKIIPIQPPFHNQLLSSNY